MAKKPSAGRTARADGRVALGFAGLYASQGDHVGHFYRTRDEWKSLVVSFLKVGLEEGEKCVYLMGSEAEIQELRQALGTAGVDVESALGSGQLALAEGLSEPRALQEWLRDALAEIPESYPFLRWGGDMTWSLRKIPTTEQLMEWETHCNIIEDPPAVFLCQYDLQAFGGDVVMDALRTHPVCVVGQAIHQNPLYEEPKAFLQELHQRQAPPHGAP